MLRVAARYALMKQMRLTYCIPRMCRFFRVSASGYYKWLNAPPSRHAREEARLEIEIQAAHKRTRETSGPKAPGRPRRTRRERWHLQDQDGSGRNWGYGANKSGSSKQRRTRNIRFPWRKPPGTELHDDSAKRGLGQRPDLVPTDEGWLYCAAHKDPSTGRSSATPWDRGSSRT